MRKQDLAKLYFPEKREKPALDNLNRWIKKCQPLKKELSETGYKIHSKDFTPRQIALIYYWLGEP